MTRWQDQPAALRATLNPLLVAGVLAWSSRAYQEASDGDPMPWPLAFVTPALVLHVPSRTALPGSTAKRLLTWRDENDLLVSALPSRCTALRTYNRAGLRAGLRHGLLAIDGAGLRGLLPSSRTPGDLRELQRASALIGRWFAPLPTATVLATLGMTP
ncbi:three component ABC system middle component [Blastococcus sp. SYSU DS0619]